MNEEEMLKNIRKQIENTIKANECGLSNNDFKEDLEALELLHDRYLKEKEERQYEKELRLKYERRYNSKIEENKKLKEKNKELENADLTTVYMNGFYDGEKKWKDKIKQRINEIDDTGIRTFNEQINMELKRIDNQRIEDLQELLKERN